MTSGDGYAGSGKCICKMCPGAEQGPNLQNFVK